MGYARTEGRTGGASTGRCANKDAPADTAERRDRVVAVSRKVLDVFALPAAFLLILVVVPGAWSIVVGDANSEGWA